MMKKFFYLAIAAVMSVALASCGGDKEPEEKAAYAITISDVTATTANVTITPKDSAAYYYWNIIDAAEYQAILDGDYAEYEITDIASYNNYMIDFLVELYAQYGMDLDIVEDLLSKGKEQQVVEELEPETKYIIVAMAANEQGICSGEVCTAEFTTEGVPQSANKITLTYANGKININTTNNDPYIFWLETKEEYDQYQKDFSDASLKAEMDEWFNAGVAQYVDYAIMTGNASFNPATEFWTNWFEGSMAAGEYVAWAIPYNVVYNGPASYLTFNYAGGAAAAAAPAYKLAKKVAGKKAPVASVRSFVVK